MQVAEVPRARRVDDLRAGPAPRLPHAERCAGRVDEAGASASGSAVVGRAGDPAARRVHGRGGDVGVVDRDVGVPRRRRFRPRHADPGDVLAVEPGDQVVPGRVRWHRVLERPAEQRAVEVARRVPVRRLDVDPARHAMRVGPRVSHAHRCTPVGGDDPRQNVGDGRRRRRRWCRGAGRRPLGGGPRSVRGLARRRRRPPTPASAWPRPCGGWATTGAASSSAPGRTPCSAGRATCSGAVECALWLAHHLQGELRQHRGGERLDRAVPNGCSRPEPDGSGARLALADPGLPDGRPRHRRALTPPGARSAEDGGRRRPRADRRVPARPDPRRQGRRRRRVRAHRRGDGGGARRRGVDLDTVAYTCCDMLNALRAGRATPSGRREWCKVGRRLRRDATAAPSSTPSAASTTAAC